MLVKRPTSSRPHLPRLHTIGMIETSWSRTKPVWISLDQSGLGDEAIVHGFFNHSGQGKLCLSNKKKFKSS